MNDLQILSFCYVICIFFLRLLLFLFWDNFENRCFLASGFIFCVVVFFHEKENLQCFSPLLSRRFPSCFGHVLYPELGTIAQMYHNQDTFNFSQGLVTKNQPLAVRV